MPCYTEYSIPAYLESKTKLLDRIQAIDVLIDNAILLMGTTVSGPAGNISSYELDDSQVRIKTGYRSMQEVEEGIRSLERMKQMYVNRLNGRAVVLQDKRTFR